MRTNEEGKAEIVPFDMEARRSLENSMDVFMEMGERVLGCCTKDLNPEDYPEDYKFTDKDPDNDDKPNFPINKGDGLVFLGLVSIQDPPRAAVPDAVSSCKTAGIKVVMVTGDHPKTAASIARQVNIITGKTRTDLEKELGVAIKWNDPRIDAIVVTGIELASMNEKKLDQVLDFDQIVFARTSPKQKLIIVQGLQNKQFIKRNVKEPVRVKHVVAVTGDGVNDSPALKAANIGIAMGIVGSEVAKDAADMILLNDNFASIVDGVEEGRIIFDNLKKSIAYTLSSNIPEISPFLMFIVFSMPLPLPTQLILCIDLGTDMVPAISLAYENKEANIMLKKPRDMHKDRLVTAKLVSFSYLQIGLLQALGGFYAFFVVLYDYGFYPNILFGLVDGFKSEYLWPDATNPTEIRFEGKSYPVRECLIHTEGVCHNPEEALAHAQCAFFISIIVVQWADLVACKTRELSLATQGLRNGTLNFGLVFETILGALLCYITPLNGPLNTRPLEFLHWLPALPFCMLILAYDETRKFFMRTWGKDNWLKRNTYY
jgi:sodium/potassium-transporting ATPase subunit alpha